jgi:hypothetical protein
MDQQWRRFTVVIVQHIANVFYSVAEGNWSALCDMVLGSGIGNQASQEAGIAAPREDPFDAQHQPKIARHDGIFLVLSHGLDDTIGHLVGIQGRNPPRGKKKDIDYALFTKNIAKMLP